MADRGPGAGPHDWKFPLGLELDDPGFDVTALGDFRARLFEHGLAERLLDLVLSRCSELGLLRAGGRAHSGSTHILASGWVLNWMEFVGETLRAVHEASKKMRKLQECELWQASR